MLSFLFTKVVLSKLLLTMNMYVKLRAYAFCLISFLNMRPDLPKCAVVTHNFNAHFSPPLNRYNNRQTVHLCTIYGQNSTVCFCFFNLSGVPKCPGSLQMAPFCLKQTTLEGTTTQPAGVTAWAWI